MMQTEISSTPSTFQIKSTVRSVQTRTQRYAAPAAIRRVQYVLDTQQRLVPGRTLQVSEDDVRRNIEHLKTLQAQGICEVLTPDGRKLDLETFTVKAPDPLPPSPKFRDDSIANDLKPGETFHLQYAPNPGEVVEPPPYEDTPPPAETTIAATEPMVGTELGLNEDPMLANPDFAPVAEDAAPVDAAVEEEIPEPLPQPVSNKKNKRRLPWHSRGFPEQVLRFAPSFKWFVRTCATSRS